MGKKHMFGIRNIMAAALAATLALGAPAAVFAEAENNEVVTEAEMEAKEDVQKQSYRVWQSNTRMSITMEDQLMKEAGMSIDVWDEETAKMKQEGLENPLSEEDLLGADAKTLIRKSDGQVHFIGPNSKFGKISSPQEAYRLAYSLMGMLGGSEAMDLRMWSRLGINEETIYFFQQIADSEVVKDSSMKIALNKNKEVTAIFANLNAEESAAQTVVNKAEAEAAAQAAAAQTAVNEAETSTQTAASQVEAAAAGKVLHEYTQRVVVNPVKMGVALDLSRMDVEEPERQLLWAVYTTNEGDEEYPYLANYIKLDGTYSYSLPVKEPGDEEACNGYRKQDVFAGMTAGEYTGTVSLNGQEKTITVPVMYHEAEGKWYLGDVSRRIAVADFYEAAYGDEHRLNLVGSKDNADWDNEDLLVYDNLVKTWDFYADMGWIGPDGQGTDVLLLKGLAFRDKTPYVNACYVAKLENYQVFAYTPYDENGKPVKLMDAMDVMAHEFTHCVTGTVVNTSLYENDQGAINEAMSDIMGNLAEYILRATEDTEWMIGENTDSVIRCMSDPNKKGQPTFVWDIYYGPKTTQPTTINDRGGVHSNSSLLSRIAALLCLKEGMSYEDAAAFWMMTEMGLTAAADYVQMADILEWAAGTAGLEAYHEALAGLIEEERLRHTELPQTLPEGDRVVILELPDTQAFEDENWVLKGYQMNTEDAAYIIDSLEKLFLEKITNPDTQEETLEILKEMASHLKVEETGLKGTEITLDDSAELNGYEDVLVGILRQSVRNMFTMLTSWEEEDSGEIKLVAHDHASLYTLMNVSIGDEGPKINSLLVLLGGHWYDMGFIADDFNNSQSGNHAQTEQAETNTKNGQSMPKVLGEIVLRMAAQKMGLLPKAQENDDGRVKYLPTEGLEEIQLVKE